MVEDILASLCKTNPGVDMLDSCCACVLVHSASLVPGGMTCVHLSEGREHDVTANASDNHPALEASTVL